MLFLDRVEVAPPLSGPRTVVLSMAYAVLDVHERLYLGPSVGARELHGDSFGSSRNAALVSLACAAILESVLVNALAVAVNDRLVSRFPGALAALHTLEA